MSTAERDLVSALRAELAALDPDRACDLAAELAGLGPPRGGRDPGPRAPVTRDPATRDPVLARLELRLARRPAAPAADAFAWERAAEHCRLAYLRGLFLARGSLSVAGGRTHLEFVMDPGEAPLLARRLSGAGLPASWRIRRRRGVVTWKSAEMVGLFLRRIGAGAALLELEARQVSRTLRGELNRVLNAESANLQRSVTAAGRQLAAIDVLEADGRLAEQPYVVRVVAEARRETPEATLGELAERLGLHRSGVQRALERMERVALHGEARGVPLA